MNGLIPKDEFLRATGPHRDALLWEMFRGLYEQYDHCRKGCVRWRHVKIAGLILLAGLIGFGAINIDTILGFIK